MNKQLTKEKIKKLVERYGKLNGKGVWSYDEPRTKQHFIRPMFEALGWDFLGEDVWQEKNVQGKRADYAFMINGITKFFVETKSLKTDLDLEIHAKQAINYAWNKGITWAVLTDFEGIKVFNAQAQSKLLQDKLVFEIKYSEYLKDFDRLWLLSRKSFLENELDKYAEKYGKKLKKLTVNDKLYSDLKEVRKELTNGFGEWDNKVDKETLEEGVQRIIERLMFIRVLEDKNLEEPVLKPVLREWEKNKNIQLFTKLITKFRELDDIYNSDLFDKHACEDWEEYSVKWNKIFSLLYGSHVYEYNFKKIPADILGGVYESYLGYIAQNPIEVDKEGKSGKLLKFEDNKEIKAKSRQKRKEHGIYYTPNYIVDYIVKNTLGRKLEEVKSMHELKQIKVLDPACGSGSFLTKALQAINEKYIDFNNPGNQGTKSEILLSNIYGVDLDPQAVDLAKLNLLISALDEKAKLPDLTSNIRVGNSLISGTEKELKKYFGKEWGDKRPFNWEKEFGEVLKKDGFDVIIGNPPYGAELTDEDKSYFKTYDIGSTDTAILFIKKAIELLKDDGRLGFIVPKALCFASNYKKTREYIWDYIDTIIDCGKVWSQVKLEQVVFVLRKNTKSTMYKSGKMVGGVPKIFGDIEKADSKKFGFFLNSVSPKEVEIAKKIKNTNTTLNDISSNKRGLILNRFIERGKFKVIGGKEINRYGIRDTRGLIDENLTGTSAEINDNSVLVQGIVAHIENPTDHIKIIATILDDKNYFIADNINQITVNNSYSNYFVWAILNSELMNWYCYRFIYGKSIRTMRFDNPVTSRIPIPKMASAQQKDLVKKAKEIIKLNRQLQSIPENSDKWNSVNRETKKVDEGVDEMVYELYGLGVGERKIVENK